MESAPVSAAVDPAQPGLPDGLRGFERLERTGDPGSAWRVETVGQLPPGGFRTLFIVASAPGLFPKVLAPGQLVGGQRGLVRIDVHRVGIDAHAQLGAAGGMRKEARLQPHREQHDRLGRAEGKLRPHVGRVWNGLESSGLGVCIGRALILVESARWRE